MNASMSMYVLETMNSFDTLQLEIHYTTYKVEKWVASKRKYRKAPSHTQLIAEISRLVSRARTAC